MELVMRRNICRSYKDNQGSIISQMFIHIMSLFPTVCLPSFTTLGFHPSALPRVQNRSDSKPLFPPNPVLSVCYMIITHGFYLFPHFCVINSRRGLMKENHGSRDLGFFGSCFDHVQGLYFNRVHFPRTHILYKYNWKM